MALQDGETPLTRLLLSVADGRMESPRSRQSHLQTLHAGLAAAASRITSALAADAPLNTPAEIEAEYAVALDAVRHFYDALSSGLRGGSARADEYAVAKGRSNLGRRVGVGIVVVRTPAGGAEVATARGGWSGNGRLFGSVVPLAAALAGGNCVVVELLRDTGLQTDNVLRDVLTKALDGNVFWVSDERVTDKEVLEKAVLVDQTDDGGPVSLTRHLVSSSQARVVAVVDRSADVEAAAKAITTARFSFGGASPYAPDLVLVNEFVKAPFYEACSRYATRVFAGNVPSGEAREEDVVGKAIREAETRQEVVGFGSQGFKLVDILDRTTPITKMKISGRYLPIATCSSLVDAAFSLEIDPSNPLLAGYIFADPPSAKYLAQYLPCHISCVNHIPAQLLLGPAAPIAHGPDLLYRYSPEMFSVPRPQIVPSAAPTEVLRAAEEVLEVGDGKAVKKNTATPQKLRALATRPLKPTGQPKSLEGLDHFASGLFLGGGLVLAVVLPAVGWTSYVLGKGAFGYLSRLRRN